MFMPVAPVLVVVLVVVLFAAWSGPFAVSAPAVVVGHLVLVAVAAVAGRSWRDPLRLGPLGNGLLVVLALGIVLAWYQSPVPRAGRTALVLLPAFLLLPAFVERAWATPEARRWGLRALSVAVAAVSAWALFGVVFRATPGASLPLGHHNLLAAWLLTLLPLAVLPWRDGGAGRVLAVAAALLGGAALVLTRSLSGAGALGVVLVVALWRRRPLWGLGLAAVLVALASPRLASITAGEDVSVLARRGYLEAATRGVFERPLLGWGPGATRWTLGRFLVPQPGVHPPDEVVADVHCWPLELAYEVGLPVALLGIAVAVVYVRRRRTETPVDPGLAAASLLGLLGFAVTSLAGRPTAAPAVLVAALAAAGAGLAALERRPETAGRLPLLLPAVMLFLLAAPDRAHLAYDRAARSDDPATARAALERAVALDPSFPLYRFRLALLERDASLALQAAEDASDVAHLWLAAGVLRGDTEALVRACDLNPLGALAPLHLALGEDDPRAPAWAARALLAEPLLLAAEGFTPGLADAAVAELDGVAGVETWWTHELGAIVSSLPSPAGTTRGLVLEMDAEAGTALSLHVFRRRPWPVYLDQVRLDTGLLPHAALESAARRPETAAGVFARPGCGLPR